MSTTTPVSDTGAWIDLDSGEVVDKAPGRGVQLCPPGGELTPDRQGAIERARATAAGESGVETATAKGTVKRTRTGG